LNLRPSTPPRALGIATGIASISVGSAFILRKSVALPSLLGG